MQVHPIPHPPLSQVLDLIDLSFALLCIILG